jgi:hypothetical protein
MSVPQHLRHAVGAAALTMLFAGGCQSAPAATQSTSGRVAGSPVATATLEVIVEPAASATATDTPTEIPTEIPTEVPTATSEPTATARPAGAVPAPPARLVIEDINLDRELLAVGLDAQNVPIVPDHDIGWYTYSARPGQGENVVFWGHVLRFRNAPEIPAPFADLDDLPVGSELSVVDSNGVEHRYEVIERVLATPDQVEYILPRGRELVTLVSCYGEQTIVDGSVELSHRLITIAAPVKP